MADDAARVDEREDDAARAVERGGLLGEGRRAWRLIGRVLRTLGGKNKGKCRLRAHQHPL